MTVQLASPKEKYMFEGEYDPMVASENGAKFLLRCDGCKNNSTGTSMDLQEAGWTWGLSLDSERIVITDSEATCPKCNGVAKDEELTLHEKAQNDKQQATLMEASK